MQYFRANPVSGGQLKLNSQRRPITSEKIFVISDLVSMHIVKWTYLNGSPFGGFQKVYSDKNNVWYVNNYAWGNYESGGTISVTCLNIPGAGI